MHSYVSVTEHQQSHNKNMVMTPITKVGMCVTHSTAERCAAGMVQLGNHRRGTGIHCNVLKKIQQCSLIPVCTVQLPIKLVEYLFKTQWKYLKNPDSSTPLLQVTHS
jgi:hypothetical protein